MIVLPTYIKKAMDATANIDATKMVVNNFFVHWLKELDIKRYLDEIRILPTNNTVDIYRYSEKMLKHLPQKALDTIKETLLCSKLPVISPEITTENLSILPQQQTEQIKTRQTE